MIPIFKPSMNVSEILKNLEAIFKSGWIGLGPKTKKFEELFAEYIGVNYAIAVNSATSALHLSLVLENIQPEDEILVPSLTFVSTALVVLYEKAVLVFVDIDPLTLCMNPKDLEKKITNKSKVIIPVHFGGHPCDMTRLMKIAKNNNLKVIEDCAHSTGSSYKGLKTGSIGDYGCFSFHAVKNLPSGDGGIITTNNKEIYERAMRLRWIGINKDTWKRNDSKYSWKYSINELGYKYHMNDITAVICLAQLKQLESDNDKRRKLFKNYCELLNSINWIELPVWKEGIISSCHNYVVKVKNGKRNDLIKYLANNGIAAGVHYEPVHYYKVFENKCRAENLKVTEKIWEELITLPLFPDLTDKEQLFIVDKIKKFC